MRGIVKTVVALLFVAACGNTDRPLRDLQSAGGGPDEFAVIPQEPLVIPADRSLPQPTPGGSNLADPAPNADAIAALGGAASAQVAGGVPAGDAAIVAQASRYGVDPAIRASLAAADEARLDRARRSNIFNPLGRDRYFPAYARQALDPFAELDRLRGLGVAVPTVPVAVQTEAEAQSITRGEQDCAWVSVGGGPIRRVCTPVEEDPA